jgi:hypothetical protein
VVVIVVVIVIVVVMAVIIVIDFVVVEYYLLFVAVSSDINVKLEESHSEASVYKYNFNHFIVAFD